LVPVILVAIGLAFALVSFFNDSPERNLLPTAFGYKQKILYNEFLDYPGEEEEDDISPSLLLSSLPDFDTEWEIVPHANKELDVDHVMYDSLEDFDSELKAMSVEEAGGNTRYGSYYIMEANNKTKSFKVATFVNITIQDAAVYHP
jgi:hypothetical protein